MMAVEFAFAEPRKMLATSENIFVAKAGQKFTSSKCEVEDWSEVNVAS